jgi:hypothetical protein
LDAGEQCARENKRGLKVIKIKTVCDFEETFRAGESLTPVGGYTANE